MSEPNSNQTELGPLPADWRVGRLGDLCTHLTVGFVGSMAHLFRQHGIPLLRGQNVLEGRLNLNDMKYVGQDTHRLWRKSSLIPGDVVMVRVGYPGTACVIPKSLGPANAASLVVARPEASKLSSRYAAYVINSSIGKKQIDSFLVGGAQQVLNTKTAASLGIPLPPTTAEQDAIAEALSDADALIESLEQLIAKKRLIKQGVMQELLTGKRRLPGFEGEWTPTTLGKLGVTYGGLTGKSKQHFGHGTAHYVPFLNVVTNTVIDLEDLDRVVVAKGESQNLVQKGDLLFNGSSETPEEVGLCCWVSSSRPSMYLNSFCFGFRLFDTTSVSGQFMAYFIRGPVGRELMKSLAQGSTRYNLSKRALLEAAFPIPLVKEQLSIERVLSDMDSELDALGQRLRKAHTLKQGMMQQLLTGRIRLT